MTLLRGGRDPGVRPRSRSRRSRRARSASGGRSTARRRRGRRRSSRSRPRYRCASGRWRSIDAISARISGSESCSTVTMRDALCSRPAPPADERVGVAAARVAQVEMLLGAGAGGGERASRSSIAALEGRGRGIRVARPEEARAAVVDDLARAAGGRGDHRHAARERLDERHAVRLAVGRVEQHAGVARAPRRGRPGGRRRCVVGPACSRSRASSCSPAASSGPPATMSGTPAVRGRSIARSGRFQGVIAPRNRALCVPVGVAGAEALEVDAGADDLRCLSTAEVVGDRLRQREHEVGALGGRAHRAGDRAARQEVVVLEHEARVRLGEAGQERGVGERGAHAPGDDRVRAQGLHELAHLAPVRGEPERGRGALAAQLDRALAQREARACPARGARSASQPSGTRRCASSPMAVAWSARIRSAPPGMRCVADDQRWQRWREA